jgi:tripartite ATP-independent transporter DctM subunit
MNQQAAALLRTALRVLDGLTAFLAVLFLVAVIGDVLAGVISRYVFNASFSWTEVGGRWLFIYMIFHGIALAHRELSHVRMDVLTQLLPPRYHAAQFFVINVIVAYTTFSVLFYGIDLIRLGGGVDILLHVPRWMKFAAIPFTSVIALIFLTFRDLEEGKSPLPGLAAVTLAGVLFLLNSLFNPAGHMPPVSPSLIMGVAFLITLMLGVPVAFAMLFSAFLAIFGADLQPPPAVVQNIVNGAGNFLLLAIPLFIMASHLMNVGGLSARLIDFARACVGNARGGLAQVNVLTSFLFGGISGSSGADAALNSKIIVPQMVRHGYSAEFSCAITSASSILPNVIPPSVAMLILAAISGTSVWKLFVGGVGPAILLAGLLMLMVYIISRRRGYGRTGEKATLRRTLTTASHTLPVLSLAFFIVAGIRFGVVTPTEAGGLAVVYAFFLGKIVYNGFRWSELYGHLRTVATEASMIGFLVGVAMPFAFVLVTEQVPQALVAQVMGLSADPFAILLIVIFIGLVMGTALDLAVSMLILVPLVMPLVRHVGIDETHFGIVTVVTLLLGGLTPPVGIIVFIPAQITNTPVAKIFREVLPFLAVLIVGLCLLALFPSITLTLVHWVK